MLLHDVVESTNQGYASICVTINILIFVHNKHQSNAEIHIIEIP